MSIEAVRARIAEIESSVSHITQGFSSNVARAASAANGAVSAQSVSFASALSNAAGELAPSGVNPTQFSSDVLKRIGAPVTGQNLAVMGAWIKAEGTKAAFNPLATVRKAPGATDFNSVGVKNFTSYEQGVDTTVGAITNGLYDDVIAALRRGDDAYAVADAIAASPWGSGALVRKVLNSSLPKD
jgi:hypothetical protein